MLFKEEVRNLDENFTAGCERMFINDILLLNSKKYLKNVYTTSKNNLHSISKNRLHSIPYPHELIPFLYKIIERFNINKHISSLVLKFTTCVLQLYYASIFLINEHKSDQFYVYQVPAVGIFFPDKTVVTYHNFCPNLDYVFNILFLLRKDASNIRLLFVSDSLYKHFLHEYPILKKCKSNVLHNAADIKRFRPQQNKTKKISFVFLSAWIREKGIYMLPNIIRYVNRRYLNKVNFVIGGSSRLWSMPDWQYNSYNLVQNKIFRLGEEFVNVKIIGETNYEKIPSILSNSTFCLLPSLWAEPFSLLAVESLACGTPVIAFNVGGNKEIIVDKENGYLAKDKNVDSLKKLIIKIISDFNLKNYNDLSSSARLSSEKYSAEDRNNNLINILLDCNG